MHQMEDDPGKRAGGEIECAAFKTVGYLQRAVGASFGDGHFVGIVGGLGEEGGQVCHEIQADDDDHQSDDEGLQHIPLRDGQHHWEEVEHTGQ